MLESSIEARPEGYVAIRVEGRVDRESLLDLYRTVLTHHAGSNRLWLYEQASLTSLSRSDLTEIAEFAGRRESGSPVKVAIVAVRDVEYGISRTFETLAEIRYAPRMRVFRDEATAVLWITGGCLEDAG